MLDVGLKNLPKKVYRRWFCLAADQMGWQLSSTILHHNAGERSGLALLGMTIVVDGDECRSAFAGISLVDNKYFKPLRFTGHVCPGGRA
jgi:hypothetical protein